MLSRYRDSMRAWTEPIGHALVRLHLRPNHLTVAGLGVSLLAAAAFVAGRTRAGGALILLAGLFDFFDGALARASGRVTPFGAFLDSVIDRYSDVVVLLGIVVLFAQLPHTRGVMVAMASVLGSVMVSYTKARAESIGIECNVGVMERPERMICLIVGALLDLLEPALWVLAVLSNLTAIQRIIFTRRAARDAALLSAGLAVLLMAGPARAEVPVPSEPEPAPSETERAWASAVAAFQAGEPLPLVREFASPPAQNGPIGDYAGFLLADALARIGDDRGAQAAALVVADRYPGSRLAPPALLLAATLAARVGDDDGAQTLLKRLLTAYPEGPEAPEALYLLGVTGEGRGQLEAAALAYRELRVLAPASGWAEGASDRLEALINAGVRVPPLSLAQRLDRAERLRRGDVPKTALDEAERITQEASDPSIVVRALRTVADAAARLRRYEVAARAMEAAASRAPADQRPALLLRAGELWRRAGQRDRALVAFGAVEARGAEHEAAEAAYQRGEAFEDLGRTVEAAKVYQTVASRYPAREVARKALWRLGWLEYLRNDLPAAAKTWRRLASLAGGSGWLPPALYWAGRALEPTDASAGDALYRRVLAEAPRSYYGVLAMQRVASPPEAPAPNIRLPADPRQALVDDPGLARADLLRRIGLAEYAITELEEVVGRSVGDPVRLYAVSGAFVEEERYHLAIRILRPSPFAGAAVTGHATLPRAFWEMLYPFAWRAEITEVAESAGLDPYLVAAVVREESWYYPRAVSPAGARGLMQLMPKTARVLAESRGMSFDDEGGMLDEPRTNIELGAAFLASLMREWGGDPRRALAAYNAGPPRARQWWQSRRIDDIEAWVEQIPFDETRLYVKRVMLSWEEYRRIYGSP
jgi:soluble lytic murein transglycosylase